MSLAVVHTAPATRRRADVREVVEELHRRHPRMGVDRLAEMLVERLEEDHYLLLNAGRFLVERVLAIAETRQRQRRAAPSLEQRTARKAVEREQVKTLVEKVKATVLDMEIGGRKLRFLTGAEVARLGGGFVKLAERVPADCLVGEILTETEAQELMRAP